MSLLEIKEKILAEARAEADRIDQQAQVEAALILKEARQQAGLLKEQILTRARQKAVSLAQAAQVEESMTEQKSQLGLKQGLVDQVLAQAKQAVLAWPDPDYDRFLQALIKTLPPGFSPVAAAVPEHKERQSRKALEQFFLGLTPEKIIVRSDLTGGIYLSGRGYDLDLTLDSILDDLKHELTGQLCRMIFPDQGKI